MVLVSFHTGFALIMEGVMSACYHVCPNYSNFQFGELFSSFHGTYLWKIVILSVERIAVMLPFIK